MPGRYYPGDHRGRHGGGGGQRPGSGIPANINVGPDVNPHHAVAGPPGGGIVAGPNAMPHPHSLLSPESIALAHLRQKSISHPMQQCQLTIYVPPHTVGAVIGRGGRTILNVQREAMRRSAGHVAPVRISVLGSNSSGGQSASANASSSNPNGHANQQQQQEGPADSNQGDPFPTPQQGGQSSSTWNYHEYLTQQQQQQKNLPSEKDDRRDADEALKDELDDWTPVIIRGDPVGCFAAVRQILPLVDHSHDRDVVLEVPVHRAKHNTLVGRGGVTIAALSAAFETRIMIPPNEFMSNVGGMGGENFWKKREEAARDEVANAGSVMLFGDSGGGNRLAMGPGAGGGLSLQPGRPGTLPPNIIQLEGEIDRIEPCLVKMLSIVAGERWIPAGTIVEKAEAASTGSGESAGAPGSPPGGAPPGRGSRDGATTAEAVIVKIWTPSSKLLNLGKIRKVQRKTNTVIRRKKLRLTGSNVDGVLANEKEEDVVDDEGVEPSLLNEEDNDEDDGVPREVSFSGPKTATKYIITGKTEAVLSATAQFEKILGLAPGSSAITDTTHKTFHSATTPADKDGASGGDPELGGGGVPGGKKMRRKKKRGGKDRPPRGSRDGPPSMVMVERGDV